MALADNPYVFKFSDGTKDVITPEQAAQRCKAKSISIVFDGYEEHRSKLRRGIKDGFKPGHQPHLGNKWIGGPREYARTLREMGLIEAGDDYNKPNFIKEVNYKNDLNLARDLSSAGLSDREIDAFMRGEI